jgi:hypothetical protein
VLLVQSESFVPELDRTAFDEVPKHGGTLVLAGDSIPLIAYASALGVTIDLIRPVASATSADGQLALALDPPATHRVRADNATPLLVTANGDWLALRKPYQSGFLVVIATPQPLTNAALREDATARFVYRELLSGPLAGGAIAFDESHHSYAPPTVDSPATVNQLLFQTAPGRAVVYGALLVFVFLLLGSRRLGPPVAARSAIETRRTMYEHVQMLATLYRRAGQLDTLRSTFVQHYTRALARSGHAARLAEAVARIEAARSERDLLEAVVAADEAT